MVGPAGCPRISPGMEPTIILIGYEPAAVVVWVGSALMVGLGLGILISALVVARAHRRGWV